MTNQETDRHRVMVERKINAPLQTVFDAFMDPSVAARWMFGPQTYVAEYCMEPKVGGRFTLLMKGEEQDWPHDGRVLVYDPPQRLAFTWLSPSTAGVVTKVDIQFHQINKTETLISLTHENLGENYNAFGKGWHALFDQLAQIMQMPL